MSKVALLAPGKIGSMIELVASTGSKYQELLHDCAVQCLAHAAEHGDRSLLARLIGGKIKSKDGTVQETYPGVLSRATSPRELRKWVQAHSPLRWDADDAIVVSKTAVKAGETYNIETANAEPFWDLPSNATERLRPISMDNIQAVVFSARKRFDNAMADHKFEGDPKAMDEYLKAIEAIPMPKVDKRRFIKADFNAPTPETTETEALGSPPAVVAA